MSLDEAGFERSARELRPDLVRLCALLTADPDEAESLAQESLTRAFARRGDFLVGASFPAWVRGIAVNLCREFVRNRATRAAPTSPDLLAPAPAREGRTNGVLSGILRDELSARLWAAVSLLPLPYREAVVLHYVEGLDYDAISAITGVSTGALRARSLRARGLLRDSLGSVVDTWFRGPSE